MSLNNTRISIFTVPVITAAFMFPVNMTAQPYLDIANGRYVSSPDAGVLNRDKHTVKIQYLNLGVNIPIQFRNNKDAVILSPYFEEWWSAINNGKRQHYSGIALPVSLVKSIPNTKWGVLISAMVRMNDSSINKRTRMQTGGAFLVTYKRKDNLTWKLGMYINNELFGLFVMPLAGIDWRINARNNLFGVLPGNITYEHKINGHLYYGAVFRAMTNSYGKGNGYWRMDENQLGIYLDTYAGKNLVFNVEAGHSLFRKIRTGEKNVSKTDAGVNDNLYFKASLAYRVRFAKS